jgi:hypothetical protein
MTHTFNSPQHALAVLKMRGLFSRWYGGFDNKPFSGYLVLNRAVANTYERDATLTVAEAKGVSGMTLDCQRIYKINHPIADV